MLIKKTALGLSFVGVLLATSGCATMATALDNLMPTKAAENEQQDFYNQAVDAIDKKNYSQALDLLQQADQHRPNDVRVLNAYGVVYDKMGRFELSAHYYQEARALDPTSPILAHNVMYSNLLRQFISAQKQMGADKRAAKMSAEVDTLSASLRLLPAPALPTAATLVQEAPSPAPQDLTLTDSMPKGTVEHVADVLNPLQNSGTNAIQVALDEHRYSDVSSLLSRALLNKPDDPQLTVMAGDLSLARGSLQDALVAYKQVDSKSSYYTRALEGEGIALSMLGRDDEAMTVLQSAVDRDPAAWKAWNALGSQYDRQHEWAKAEAAYNHAMVSNSALVLNNRGYSRMSQGRLSEAIGDFVAALQRQPDLAYARTNLRLAIALQGDYGRALEGASAGERAAVLNNTGFAAMMRGDYAKAHELLGQAIEARGKYYEVASSNLQANSTLQAGNGQSPP